MANVEFDVTITELATTLGTPEGLAQDVFRRLLNIPAETKFTETLTVRLVEANPTLWNCPAKMIAEYLVLPGSTVTNKATFLAYYKKAANSLMDLRPFA